MKHINLILTAFVLMLMLASCGSGGDEPASVDEPKVELRMIVQAPDAATRIADPGTGTGEADTWDTFVLAFVYKNSTTPTHTVVVDKLTREQFEKLDKYNDSENVRYYSVQLAKGVVYCYGVVYSSKAANGNIYSKLQSCTTKEQVDNCRISNSYAAGNADATSMFLSVATGYYRDLTDNSKQGTIDISNPEPSAENPYKVSVLRLSRLAAKIDVQWDAASAFTNSSLRAYVTGFKYTSNPAVTDAGSGRLFPDLATATDAVGGSATFINATETSQRNGRAYHYVFPESYKTTTTLPKITFDIKGRQADGTEKESTVTVKFKSQPQAATWYKINATVKGISSDREFEWDISQTQGTN